MNAALIFSGALYLAVPNNFTPQQEQLLVAAISAAKDVPVTAVEVKDEKDKGPRMVILSEVGGGVNEQPPRCCPPPRPYFPPPPPEPENRIVAPIFTMAGSSGPNFFISGGGVKLGAGTVILLAEGGLGEPEGIFEESNDDIYGGLGLTGKIDPLAITRFPVRPTVGYRFFRLFVDEDVFDRKFYTEGWIIGVTATVYRGYRDEFELWVDAGENRVVNKVGEVTFSRKKTIWVAGFAYTF